MIWLRMADAEPLLEQQFGVPRCRKCSYVLENLPEPRCPECGTSFDLDDPQSYTIKPPIVRWRFWMPGLLLALGGGLALYLFLVPFIGFAVTTTLILSASVGAIIGYSCRVRVFMLVLAALATVGGMFIGCMAMDFTALFCGLVLSGIALGPIAIGTAAGALLRKMLKNSSFDQRWHLPLIAFLLLPVFAALLERATYRPGPLESVRTSVVIDAPPGEAWDAIQFYEEVKHGPPPLFRIGMPRALYAVGRAAAVGDLKTCVYDKGRLTKRVTEVQPGRRLAFAVVEQGFERHSFTLTGGSFEFESVGGHPERTRVTLTTSYRPHLSPRWCWRPFEEYTVRTLHRHVLRGMAEAAEGGTGVPEGAIVSVDGAPR
jgi:hypothetical protein